MPKIPTNPADPKEDPDDAPDALPVEPDEGPVPAVIPKPIGRAGGLYVNAPTGANKGGVISTQLAP